MTSAKHPNTQMRPTLIINPNREVVGRSYKFLKFLFMALGTMVVLNLNIFSNRLVGNGQLFSPLILIVCILIFVNSKVGRLAGISLPARLFGGAFVYYIFIASLSSVAGNFEGTASLLSSLAKDAATPVVFFSAVVVASSMRKVGGELAKKQMLRAMYILSFIGVMTIFIPLVFPQWHEFIRSGGDTAIKVERYGGVYDNPNAASMAALTFMVCGLALTVQRNKMSYLIISLSLGAAAVFLTGSRIGLLCTFFVVLPLSVFVFGAQQVIRLGITGIVVGLVALGLFFALQQQTKSYSYGQADRARQLLSLFEDGLNEDNTGGRTTLFSIGAKMWLKSPTIGHGIGSSRPMEPYIRVGPHNYYLVVLIESGVVGFVPFMILWGMMGMKAFDRRNEKWVTVLIIGIFLTVSAYALTSHNVFTSRNQVFLLGTALGLVKN